MTQEMFLSQMQSLTSWAGGTDPAVAGLWMELIRDQYFNDKEAMEDTLGWTLTNLTFAACHFSTATTRSLLGSIHHVGLQPDQIIAAAFFLEAGCGMDRLVDHTIDGRLAAIDMDAADTQESTEKPSAIALYTIREEGRSADFIHTTASPRDMRSLHQVCGEAGGGRLLQEMKRQQSFITADPFLSLAMLQSAETAPALAVHISYNADDKALTTRYNPLWEKRHGQDCRQEQPEQTPQRPAYRLSQ